MKPKYFTSISTAILGSTIGLSTAFAEAATKAAEPMPNNPPGSVRRASPATQPPAKLSACDGWRFGAETSFFIPVPGVAYCHPLGSHAGLEADVHSIAVLSDASIGALVGDLGPDWGAALSAKVGGKASVSYGASFTEVGLALPTPWLRIDATWQHLWSAHGDQGDEISFGLSRDFF
jgi:hypothetical protein